MNLLSGLGSQFHFDASKNPTKYFLAGKTSRNQANAEAAAGFELAAAIIPDKAGHAGSTSNSNTPN